MSNGEYSAFLDGKAQHGDGSGFEPLWMPDFLFDFQRSLTEWAIRQGRAAIFADCGLGKTPMQLVWAENVIRHTGGRVLILTPLAVGAQTIREGDKFNIECERSRDGELPSARIVVTNYERLHYFNPSDFAGVVADESSAIKNFSGKRRAAVTEFLRTIQYRLLCTATAAPNDYIELGTSSEALGQLGYMDMLGRFFKNEQGSGNPNRLWAGAKWRLKGHAEGAFWRWVCSWARACRRPSDLGFDDGDFILPDLIEREHVVSTPVPRPGMLFAMRAVGLHEQREERRHTLQERCEKVAELVADTGRPAVCWCHLNAEGDTLAKMIPDAEQIAGADSDENKEARFEAFSSGSLRVLVIKPKIGAWGLNWQHCSHMTYFPSHSYEQYYQGVRRCWRFGQTRQVIIDNVASDGDIGITENLQRKAAAADGMFAALVGAMNNALTINRDNGFTKTEDVPAWLLASK